MSLLQVSFVGLFCRSLLSVRIAGLFSSLLADRCLSTMSKVSAMSQTSGMSKMSLETVFCVSLL